MTTIAEHEIRHRMSAGERKDEVLEAAVAEFSRKGLHGTSTEAIARRAGVSQPYLFRLFGTKKDLFIAAVERGFDRIQLMFGEAVAEAGPKWHERMQAMGDRYFALLENRENLLMQMQAYAACSDPDVQAVVRRRYGELYKYVEAVLDIDEDQVREFFAYGMLMNVAAAMDLPSLTKKESWAERCIGPETREAVARRIAD
jgi:AcrR family transcriptional regulator